jgi:chemotaxis protein MotB
MAEKKCPECKKGAPEFMNTYGDMVTLLLCFFVLLFAMSTTDSKKYQGMVESLKGALGVMPGGKTISPEKVVTDSRIQAKGTEFKYRKIAENIQKTIEKTVSEMKISNKNEVMKNIEVSVTKRGINISLENTVLFESGKAEIKQEALDILGAVAVNIGNIQNEILVEGHTDNLPINNTRYPSNWELSTSRATNVLKYMLSKEEKLYGRIAAAGYADSRPKAENTSEAGRKINRRVDIVILKDTDENVLEKIAENK